MKAPAIKLTLTDVFKNQDTSVAKAKKAKSDYKKAVGQSEGLEDLLAEVGVDD